MKFRTAFTKFSAFATGMVVLLMPRLAHADWVINGQVQTLIPFWYTLEEAVCAYMISWC